MRVSLNQRGYTLSNLTADELKTVMYLLGTVKERCFKDSDYQSDSDQYYDGGDFVATVTPEERKNLYRFVDGFWNGYQQMINKILKK